MQRRFAACCIAALCATTSAAALFTPPHADPGSGGGNSGEVTGSEAAAAGDENAPSATTRPQHPVQYDVQSAAGDRRQSGTLKRCGSHASAQDVRDAEEALRVAPADRTAWSDTLTVQVIWHVLYNPSEQVGQGTNIARSAILAQIDVMNKGFRGEDPDSAPPDKAVDVGLQFALYDIDRVPNALWASNCEPGGTDTAIKNELVREPEKYLNVISCDSGGALGWATFPFQYDEASTQHAIFVMYSTLPGGSFVPYNRGDTMTHEAGHYFGLFHTFQDNGCGEPGDHVADTPAENFAHYGVCPNGPDMDSCPGSPGMDPIQNYMDYSDDVCMNHFTSGQKERAQRMTIEYRPTLLTVSQTSQSPTTIDADCELSEWGTWSSCFEEGWYEGCSFAVSGILRKGAMASVPKTLGNRRQKRTGGSNKTIIPRHASTSGAPRNSPNPRNPSSSKHPHLTQEVPLDRAQCGPSGPLSCVGKCSGSVPSTDPNALCACDCYCVFYEDCCEDFETCGCCDESDDVCIEMCGSTEPPTTFSPTSAPTTSPQCLDGFGQQIRERTIVTAPRGTGEKCEALVETDPSCYPITQCCTRPFVKHLAEDECVTFSFSWVNDLFPQENSWDLKFDCPQCTIMQRGAFLDTKDCEVNITICQDGQYDFTVYDEYGDGICCDQTEGSYSLLLDGETMYEGGEFAYEEQYTFYVVHDTTPPTPTTYMCGDVCCEGEDSPECLELNGLDTSICLSPCPD